MNHLMLSLIRRISTVEKRIPQINILSLLKDKPLEEKIRIQGWVKSLRRQKMLTFMNVNDGSSFRNLQVVLPTNKKPASLGFHSSVYILGVLRASSHKGQEVEFIADEIEVIGDAYLDSYPFNARTQSTPDYIRQFIHLRARTNFCALLRVRSQAKLAVHQYFTEKGFISIDTPIITGNDCEGTGETFSVQSLMSCKNDDEESLMSCKNDDEESLMSCKNDDEESLMSCKNDDEESPEKGFFKHPVFLTVSGQLHLEAMASGLSKVYNFSPTFRAEISQTRRHLSEFWMVEAEEAFLSGTDGLQALTERIESLIKFTTQSILDKQEEDVFYYWKDKEDTKKLVQNMLHNSFARLTYHEAMEILLANSSNFKIQPKHGKDFGSEHELFLASYVGDLPVFVTDWPINTKAFYMASHEDNPDLVYGLDLLFPSIGEVVGGGLRDHSFSDLKQRMKKQKLLKSLNWYLDLRKFNGRVPSGGFGLGFERLLRFLLGIHNIKDTVPFPRWNKHCSC